MLRCSTACGSAVQTQTYVTASLTHHLSVPALPLGRPTMRGCLPCLLSWAATEQDSVKQRFAAEGPHEGALR